MRLVDHLRAFDSHERAILLHAATGRDFRLSTEFRQRIRETIDVAPPASAFVATDYTIDWLYAALCSVWGHVGSRQTRPTGQKLTGSIEDIDLLIGWDGKPRPRLVFVEAKGYNGWSTKQLNHKIDRLDEVVTPFMDYIDVDLILTGPAPGRGLDSSTWPGWAKPGAEPNFIELDDPGPRFSIRRCDESGHPTKTDWTHWEVILRNWKTATLSEQLK